jgi:hypothetical protein
MLVRNLFGHSAQIGMGILGALGQSSSKILCDTVQGRMPFAALSGCHTCEIPPPCWEPQPLGQVTSFVAPGGQATIRFRVTNCGFDERKILFDNLKPFPDVTFVPSHLMLGPLERGMVSAAVKTPAEAKPGAEHELVLLVRGCKFYYLRWVLKVAACGVNMCNEVEVNDCPDMIHHWYDHFYCHRHCRDFKTIGIGDYPGKQPMPNAPTESTPGTIK